MQTNFYMVAADEAEFFQAAVRRDDLRWLVGRFHATRHPVPCRSLPRFGPQQQLELVNETVSPVIFLSREGAGDYAGQYLFGRSDSHIEFARSYIKDGCLRRGRLYVQAPGADDPDEARRLQAWYRSLSAWLKRRYRRVGRYWLGPHAEEWVAQGGETFPDLAKLERETSGRRARK